MSRSSDTAVVILNWNNARDTLDCLRTLESSGDSVDILLVDNASSDDSVNELLVSGIALTVIRSSVNLGFAGGNNLGIEAALGAGYKFIIVLNNDTLVSPGLVGKLRSAAFACGPRVAVSPWIGYADSPGTPWFAGGVVDRGMPRHLQVDELAGEGRYSDTEILSGCCIGASADVWQEVGGFDGRLFLIFEDSDWSARAVRCGVRLVVNNDAHLLHKVSRSFRGSGMSNLSTYFYVRNGLFYFERYERRYFGRFVAGHVIRPWVRGGGRSVIARAAYDWLLRRSGDAPMSVWRRALGRS